MDTAIRNVFRKLRQVGLRHDETSKALMEGFSLNELEIIITAAMSAAFSHMGLITGSPAKTAIARHNDEASETGNRRLRKHQVAEIERIFAQAYYDRSRDIAQEPDLTEMPSFFIKALRKHISDKYSSMAIIRQNNRHNYTDGLVLYGLREESDKEYEGRLRRAKKKEEDKRAAESKKEAKEKAIYEKLKLKFGSK